MATAIIVWIFLIIVLGGAWYIGADTSGMLIVWFSASFILMMFGLCIQPSTEGYGAWIAGAEIVGLAAAFAGGLINETRCFPDH